jgi:hypothetical protein
MTTEDNSNHLDVNPLIAAGRETRRACAADVEQLVLGAPIAAPTDEDVDDEGEVTDRDE